MAHTAADGSKWTNASAAKRVPGRAQGDGKQPVKSFSKPEAPRQPTAEPVTQETQQDSGQHQEPSTVVAAHGPAEAVTVKHEGEKHTVTSEHQDGHKHHSQHASAGEAHQAAAQLSGVQPEQEAVPAGEGNPAQAMM